MRLRWAPACAVLWSALNAASAARVLRAGAASSSRQVYAPFDIDPDTFMSTLQSIPSDVLILFHSKTCRDCTKFLPQWVKIAHEFQDRKNLTLLTIADPRGLAPDPYGHDEIPAVFFASQGHLGKPSVLSLDDIHAFTYTPETPATEAAIHEAIVNLVQARSAAAAPGDGAQAIAPPAANSTIASDTDSVTLTARFMAELMQRRKKSTANQLEVARAKVFASLPVARYLLGLKQTEVSEPLTAMAARFLDQHAGAGKAAVARPSTTQA